MQKNEFEKQVQQKLEELKLSPSAPVWQYIEANITRARRRKRGWIFFPILFISVCYGGYFFWHTINAKENHPQTLSAKSLTKKDKFNNAKTLLKHPKAENNIARKPSQKESAVKNNQKKNKNKQLFSPLTTQTAIYSIHTFKTNNRKNTVNTFFINNFKSKSADSIRNNKGIISGNKSFIAENSQKVKHESKLNPGSVSGNNNTGNTKDSSFIKIITDSMLTVEQVKKSIQNKKNNKLKLTAAKKAWGWGLTFSAGVSGVPNSFLGSLDKSYSYADALFYSTPSLPNNSSLLPSKITSSAALIAGFFAQKNISKNKWITIGLNYKLFSSTTRVGVKNDSSVYRLANPVNTYHNYYHFVELPVSVKMKINTKILPLFLDAGLSVSQLISSNALQFNSSAAVYYKENALFNKTQAGFTSGLSASLFSSQNTSILIGPYIYYGTTKIASENLYKNQHFTFIGLKAGLLFKK